METDSNGFIYRGNMEQEAIVQYNPQNSTVTTFIRDPRINWVDTSEHFIVVRRFSRIKLMSTSVRGHGWLSLFYSQPACKLSDLTS